jgi:hypothetical protein
MSLKEDLMRVYAYGRDAYYRAIQEQPPYQRELQKIYTDHTENSWIDFSGFLPKFPSAVFEEKRKVYQSKYGTEVSIPKPVDIIHIGVLAKISPSEMAAHRYAQRRGLPSPLTSEQLKTLAYKKVRFLRALASPTPTWFKSIAAVATAMDNVEDGLVTLAVLGRLGSWATKKVISREIPGLGWVMLGADILNFFNLISWATFAAKGSKRELESAAERNPFHKKAKVRRAMKLKRTWPSIGEALEIAQTCDQLFGYGLCLGGILGMLTDIIARADHYYDFTWNPSWKGERDLEALHDALFINLATDWNTLKRYISEIAAGAKQEDEYLRALMKQGGDKAVQWIKDSSVMVWQKFKGLVSSNMEPFINGLQGALIAAPGLSSLGYEDQQKTLIGIAAQIKGLLPTWRSADPLPGFKDPRGMKFTPPAPTDLGTQWVLDEVMPNWKETLQWPFLGVREATAEEIVFNYAPRIKNEFLKFSLSHRNDIFAAIAAAQVTDFVEDTLRGLDDDGVIISSRSEYVQASITMADEHLLFPPDTPPQTMNAFNGWIESFVTRYARAPNAREIRDVGFQLNIQWMESFPRKTFLQAFELFPKWQALQDQLGDLFIPD